MVNRRNNEWERDSEVYSPAQVEAVANYCEIEIVSETNSHLLAYCPFHNNTDSPAFAIDKTKGLWTCFNPSCDNSGNLEQLLGRLKGLNFFEATRIILKNKNANVSSLAERLEDIRGQDDSFIEFPAEPIYRMQSDLLESKKAFSYMTEQRGFSGETLDFFGIGYSKKKDMVIVPMHDPTGKFFVGFVGRAIDAKVFKNSDNLPKSRTAWNFHRARTHGDTVIVVESSFDAMRVHQAGYPNVIALLGGHLSRAHVEQINKTFSTVIIMTDFDKRIYRPNCRKCNYKTCEGHRPGRELGWSIAESLPNKRIKWAAYDDNCVFPHDAKDAGDLTDDEIRECLHNAVGHFEYSRWGIENADKVLAS